MMGFKDWLTQISGAICHAPTGRPRELSPPPPLPLSLRPPTPPPYNLGLFSSWPVSPPWSDSIPPPTLRYRSQGFSSFLSVRQTPLNSKVNCEIGILARARARGGFDHRHYRERISFPRQTTRSIITRLLANEEEFNKRVDSSRSKYRMKYS